MMQNRLTSVYLVFVLLIAKSTAEEEVAKFGEVYRRTTNTDGELSIFKYSFPSARVARVWLQSFNATIDRPLMAVFREKQSVVSVQLPIIVQKTFRYHTLAQVLCPFVGNGTNGTGEGKNETAEESGNETKQRGTNEDDRDSLSVEISCASSTPVEYILNATLLDEFDLTLGKKVNLTASPTEAAIVRFRIEPTLDSVLIAVNADDDLCMTVMIQSVDECPVFESESSTFFSGIRQTMNKKAFITIQRRNLDDFYIVFSVKSDDYECTKKRPDNEKSSTRANERIKKFSVVVQELSNDADYWLPLLVTVMTLFSIYVLAFTFMAAEGTIDRREWTREGKEIVTAAAQETETHSRTQLQNGNEEAGQDDEIPAQSSNMTTEHDAVVVAADEKVEEKEIARTKVKITVGDLTLKSYKQREKKYYLYAWNLITIAMFYGLPVVQLVFLWHNTVRLSGNTDLCYFNFRCARPLFGLFAFNNIISNIGYVALGVLFLIMVKVREVRHRRTVGSVVDESEMKFGIPMHNGLLYALGIAITMEGVLSASYHVCPSSSNYQFDTTFMYIIGALGMLKLYQLRHSDINPNAHVVYAIMALFVFLTMCGVYFNATWFYAVFALCYLSMLVIINFEFYFNTQWTCDFGVFGRVRDAYRGAFTNCPKGFLPIYRGRFIFLVVADVVNIFYIIVGVFLMPESFASFLLLPFVGNLSLYTLYYLFMKKLHHEKVRWRTLSFILSAFVCWGAAIWFFMHAVSDWEVTPADSRVKNRDCILFNFYDNHDVWHFLSALSLFFSFASFLSLDDDRKWIPRDKIHVF